MKIDTDSIVTLRFALSLENGEVVDSLFDRDPATFQMGDGSLLPGFEKVLLGLQAGDRCCVTLPPEEAFGAHNSAHLQQLPEAKFNPEIVLEAGLVLEFNGPEGLRTPGVIKAVENGLVTVDLNHPLAGRDIQFEVEIVNVETPTQPVQWVNSNEHKTG